MENNHENKDLTPFPDRLKDLIPVSFLGEGSSGRVCQVKDQDGKIYAVKVIPGADPLRETALLSELSDIPGTVKVYDTLFEPSMEKEKGCPCSDKGTLYIVMESLTDLYRWSGSHPLTEKDAALMMMELADTLTACENTGILHRDIKPENILITEDGHAKLGDFGSARRIGDSPGTFTMRGTLRYMAPELRSGRRYDHRADIYSLGLVFYILLNRGRDPFTDQNKQILTRADRDKAIRKRMAGEVPRRPADVSEEFWRILKKACAFHPADRYRTASQLKEDLKNYLSGPQRKKRGKNRIFWYYWGRRKKQMFLALTALSLVALLFGIRRSIPLVEHESCGPGTFWTLYSDGRLIISGEGKVRPDGTEQIAKMNHRVRKLIVESGVEEIDLNKINEWNNVPGMGYNGIGDFDDNQLFPNPGKIQPCFPELRSVRFPKGLKKIGKYSFADCQYLKTVKIPDSVEEIGEGAFTRCYSLTRVILPKDIKTLPTGLFQYCHALSDIEIPDTVSEIGNDAFSDTFWLQKKQETEDYVVVNDILLSCKNAKGKLIIPESLGLRIIGPGAFSRCRDITEVTLPDTVTIIGDYALSGCTGLSRIHFGRNLREVRENAFFSCRALKDIQLPEGVEVIGENAFARCTQIKKLAIPESVKKIDANAFDGCLSLSEIHIPESLSYLGKDAFRTTPYLDEKEQEKYVAEGGVLVRYNGSEENVTIPSELKLTGIAGNAFSQLKRLKSVHLPEGLVWISEDSFFECEQLEEIDFPTSLKRVPDAASSTDSLESSKWGIKQIDDHQCIVVGDIYIGGIMTEDGVLEIPSGEGIRRIEKLLLQKNYDPLEKVILPENVTEISPDIFSECVGLSEVVFPDSISEEEAKKLLKDHPYCKITWRKTGEKRK